MSQTLDNYVTHSAPIPEPVTSPEIRDRSSTFIANIYKATTPAQARKLQKHMKHVVHGARPSSHEIFAWRCMVLKAGRTGLSGPDDFELNEGCEDDGEQWAGARVLKIMKQEGVLDAVVIVSRWYGGILLGPARFTHIETCSAEACRAYKRRETMDEYIVTLNSLDDIITDLRSQLGGTSDNSTSIKGKGKQDYSKQEAFDIAKAKRLVVARENTIKSLKKLLLKKEIESAKAGDPA